MKLLLETVIIVVKCVTNKSELEKFQSEMGAI